LPNSTHASTELTVQTDSISLYTDTLANVKDIISAAAIIKKSFPALPQGFYDMFGDRIMANKFTINRLRDAIAFVIDNCRYPQPSIADFVSYDKTIKFRTHAEMTAGEWDNQYIPVKFPDRPKVVWIHANDIQHYNLTKYITI